MSRSGSRGPPRLAVALLRRLLPLEARGSILGDLHQEYREMRTEAGPFRSAVWYWRQVVGIGMAYGKGRGGMMGAWTGELRHVLRGLVRRPGFALAVVGTLALAVGAGSAVFSVVDRVLLRPLPFPEADRLVRVWAADPSTGRDHLDLTYADVPAFLEGNPAFSGGSGFSVAPRALIDPSGPAENVRVARTTGGFFSVLGIPSSVGRTYARGEQGVTVLSEGLWRRRYGADPRVVGRTVAFEDDRYTVVGVVPEALGYPGEVDAWRPLTAEEQEDDDREVHLVARLAPGVGLEDAQHAVSRVAEEQARLLPESHAGHEAWVQPLHAMLVRDVRVALLALLGAVGTLLVMACVNIAGLLGTRGLARARDMAVRVALGASRARLVALSVLEALVLALAGGAAGLVLGGVVLQAILAIAPPLPRGDLIRLDLRVALVTLGVSALVGVALAAASVARGRSAGTLHAGGRGSTGSRGGQRARTALVSVEVALSTALVALGILFLGTFRSLVEHPRGFDPRDAVAISVQPLSEPEGEEAVANAREVLAAVRAVPGVLAAGGLSHEVTEQRGFRMPVAVEAAGDTVLATVRIGTPGAFGAAGVPLRAGRDLRLGGEGEWGFVVNERFARLRLPMGADPLGRRVSLPWFEGTVVGVVGDVSPVPGEPAEPIVYVPLDALPIPGLWVNVRTAGDPASLVPELRERIRAVDPSAPLDRVVLLEDAVRASMAPERFLLVLSGVFAALALCLVSVGIFGVTSLTVASRRREIAVRRALGAPAGRIVRGAAGRIAGAVAVGVAAGLLLTLLAGRTLDAVLAGVAPSDPTVLAAVAAVLATVALAAVALPLRRAVRLDPTEALREE